MLVWLVCALVAVARGVSITQFGAVANNRSVAASVANSAAFVKALSYANASTTDRVVVVPAGQEFTFFFALVSDLNGVTIRFDGPAFINNNISAWPEQNNDGGSFGAFKLVDSANIVITGSGLLDGQGYDWWWYVILTGDDRRPHMFVLNRCVNVTIHDFSVYDSPQFHFNLEDTLNVVVRNVVVNVTVDPGQLWERRRAMLSAAEAAVLPIFPLNTDGIDISGKNILVENCWIRNYDDAVCAKTLDGSSWSSVCTENMHVRNVTIVRGVGASVGSVTPSTNGALGSCIRNVVFDHITFHEPFKAVYIKSNPGETGVGTVTNISYSNLRVIGALWYPIWIGPQQEQQPGQASKGCSFFFPLRGECTTQPRVTIGNVVIRDSVFEAGVTLPGVLLCDPANPCKGITLANVSNTGVFAVQPNYYCKSAVVRAVGDTMPVPQCGQQ